MSETLGEDWHFAGNADDFEDEDVDQVKVGSLAIAVYRAKGEFYATQDLCTHEHAYLSDGVLIDCVVECPFHQGRFDVRTGAALSAPVIDPLLKQKIILARQLLGKDFVTDEDIWQLDREGAFANLKVSPEQAAAAAAAAKAAAANTPPPPPSPPAAVPRGPPVPVNTSQQAAQPGQGTGAPPGGK